MDIQKMYDDSRGSSDIKDKENLERELKFYVNGGFQGLRDIYYNYHQEQKIKFSEITTFETFINTNDLEKFYLDEVFFEVDNPYLTNIGCGIKSLCHYYSNSEKIIENKKVDLISVVTRLEQEINKSAISQYDDYPKLYNILKRIENYYRIAYSGIYEDFYPFLADRPINQSYSKESSYVFTAIKETIPLKLGVLFFTGKISMVESNRGLSFLYQEKLYTSGTSLAKVLAEVISEKQSSIKAYLNETKNNGETDKNIYFSDKLRGDIHKYCLTKGLEITDSQWIKMYVFKLKWTFPKRVFS